MTNCPLTVFGRVIYYYISLSAAIFKILDQQYNILPNFFTEYQCRSLQTLRHDMFSITRRQATTAGLAEELTGRSGTASIAEIAATPDSLPYMSPELRPFAKIMLKQAKTFTPFSARNLPAIRQSVSRVFGGPPLITPACVKRTITVMKGHAFTSLMRGQV